jgi:hypothetical protein
VQAIHEIFDNKKLLAVKSCPTFLFSRPLSSYQYVGSVFHLFFVGLLEVLYFERISYLGTLFA